MKVDVGHVSELPSLEEGKEVVGVPGEEALFPFGVEKVVEVGVFSIVEIELLTEPLKIEDKYGCVRE